MEDIYTNEASKCETCYVVVYPVTKAPVSQGWQSLGGHLDRVSLSVSTIPGMESHFLGLSPMLREQQVLRCPLLAHPRLEETPVVRKSPKCRVYPLFLLKKMPDRCCWPPKDEARGALTMCGMFISLQTFCGLSVDCLCAFLPNNWLGWISGTLV